MIRRSIAAFPVATATLRSDRAPRLVMLCVVAAARRPRQGWPRRISSVLRRSRQERARCRSIGQTAHIGWYAPGKPLRWSLVSQTR
jgi:hypothetical protein